MAPVRRAVFAILLAGCGALPPPCASSLGCGEARVCALNGRCPERAPPPAGRSVWVAPSRWAATREGGPRSDVDRAPLDARGRGALWLAFDAVPEATLRTVLVVSAHDPAVRRDADGVLIVERIADGRELARARVAPGPSRPIRVDLGEAARSGRPLEIVVRFRGAHGVLALATPLHADRVARPRLEVVVPP